MQKLQQQHAVHRCTVLRLMSFYQLSLQKDDVQHINTASTAEHQMLHTKCSLPVKGGQAQGLQMEGRLRSAYRACFFQMWAGAAERAVQISYLILT